MRETLVIALGGNAITRPGESGTIPQQFEHTAETLQRLLPLFRRDCDRHSDTIATSVPEHYDRLNLVVAR